MPASDPQIRATQAVAKPSNGPKAPEAKESSQAKVLPEREAEEV